MPLKTEIMDDFTVKQPLDKISPRSQKGHGRSPFFGVIFEHAPKHIHRVGSIFTLSSSVVIQDVVGE